MARVPIEDIDGPLCRVGTKISVKVCTKATDDSLSRTRWIVSAAVVGDGFPRK